MAVGDHQRTTTGCSSKSTLSQKNSCQQDFRFLLVVVFCQEFFCKPFDSDIEFLKRLLTEVVDGGNF